MTKERFISWMTTPSVILALIFLGSNLCDVQGDKIMACYFIAHRTFPGSAVDPNLCTHIIGSGGVVTPNGIKGVTPLNMKQYKAIASLKEKNPHLKVMVSLSKNFSSVVDQQSDKLLERFALKAVIFLEKMNMDGLDLDWEYPTRDQKTRYMKFIKVLSTFLHSSNLLLSMAIPPYPSMLNTGFDIDTINRYVDFTTVMTYDFHFYNGGRDNVTGYNSPLYTPQGSRTFKSTADSITYLLYKGLAREKILMGIPTYGRSWTLENSDNHSVHSLAIAVGPPAPYSKIKGVYLYPDVCTAQCEGVTSVQDEENGAEYLYNGSTWVAVDTQFTYYKKAKWVLDRDLAGVGIWSYNFDDLYDACGDGPMSLLKFLKDRLQPDEMSRPNGLLTGI